MIQETGGLAVICNFNTKSFMLKKHLVVIFLIIISFFQAQQIDKRTSIVSSDYHSEVENIENEIETLRKFYDSYNRYGKNLPKAILTLEKTIDSAGIKADDKQNIIKKIEKRLSLKKTYTTNINVNKKQVFFNNIPIYDILERNLTQEDLNALYDIILEVRNKANIASQIIDANFYHLRQKRIINSNYKSSYDFIKSILQ